MSLDIDNNRQQKILEYCNKLVMAFMACVCVNHSHCCLIKYKRFLKLVGSNFAASSQFRTLEELIKDPVHQLQYYQVFEHHVLVYPRSSTFICTVHRGMGALCIQFRMCGSSLIHWSISLPPRHTRLGGATNAVE